MSDAEIKLILFIFVGIRYLKYSNKEYSASIFECDKLLLLENLLKSGL